MNHTESQLRRQRIAWYGRSMGKKILSALQGLILLSTIAPFILVALLSVTVSYLAAPHDFSLYDVLSLFSIHGLMLVWLLVQGDSVSGGPMQRDLIGSLPIDESMLARVEYSVLLVTNNLIWIFFAIAAVMPSYSEWSWSQAVNFWLVMVAVANIGILLQLGILRPSRPAIAAALVLDAGLLALIAWPAPQYRAYAISGLILGSFWMALKAPKSARGIISGGWWAIDANRFFARAPIDPVVSMHLRWLLTEGLAVLGLRAGIIFLALIVPIPIAENASDTAAAQVAVVVGMGVSGLATTGLFRTFSEFHAAASGFFRAQPLSRWALPLKDHLAVLIVNLIFLLPFAFSFHQAGFLAWPDLFLLLAAFPFLLAACQFGSASFPTQSVMVSAGITGGWTLTMSLWIVGA